MNSTEELNIASDAKSFTSFETFYTFYLKEHSNTTCRRLHFLGSTLSLICLAMLA
ncbi:MAG: Mpo1-like protein, partial [Limnohabitans sp.]